MNASAAGMPDAARRGGWIAFGAAFVAIALVRLTAFRLGEDHELPQQLLYPLVLTSAIALPWAFAARLLFRAWWERHGRAAADLDGPGRLVAGAAATLPAERSEWGRAMVSELASVNGRAARWDFAAGCVRAVLVPTATGRRTVAAGAVAVLVVLGSAFVAGALMPPLRVLVVALTSIVALAVVVTVGRGGRLRPTDPVIAVSGAAGVAACVVSLGCFLVEAPSATAHLSVAASGYFAAVLAGCLWLTVAPHPRLTSSAGGRWAGVAATVVLAVGFVGTARATVWTVAGTAVWIVLAPGAVCFAAGLLAAVAGRSMAAGLQATVWTGVLGSLVVFALAAPEAVHRYAIDARLLFDGERGYPVEQNLAGAIPGFVLVALLGLPLGVVGAWLGSVRSGRRARRA